MASTQKNKSKKNLSKKSAQISKSSQKVSGLEVGVSEKSCDFEPAVSENSSGTGPMILKERYHLERQLGKGSQGQIWQATRIEDGERVAIKQLNVQSVTTWKQYELFKREAAMLESLDMDGVVPFYEYIEDLEANPPFVCIVQKFIKGQTLAQMLKSHHRFETEVVYDIVAQTLRILQKLHSHTPPVIHRDIKPSNLMLTPLGNGHFDVTLLDFGAVANPQVQNGGSTVAGTFGYMPPEQLMGQAQPASDIYALAAVAVELLSGTSPADIPVCDFKLVIEPYLSHVPSHVVQTLNAMLEPAMHNRICDHMALIAQFDDLAHKKQPSMLALLRRTAVPKLENVETICQAGNYEIWQDCDQSLGINPTHCPCHLGLSSEDIFKVPMSLKLIGVCLGLWIILSIVALIAGWYIQFALFILLLLATGGIRKQKLKSYQIHKALTGPHQSKPRDSSEQIFPILSDLFVKGEKIVGTIVDIVYQWCDEAYVTYPKKDDLTCLINYNIPSFLVIYSFKYSYKNKIHTFYGQMISHTPPEGHYKVGDPITLIADLDAVDTNTLCLSVMPYPYPYGDAMQKNEVLFSCNLHRKDVERGEILNCNAQLGLFSLSHYHDKGNPEVGLKAAEIFNHEWNASQIASQIYQEIAQHWYEQFKAGNDDAGKIAADMYRQYLNNSDLSTQIYQEILERCVAQLSDGYDETMMLKIMEICEIFEDQKLASQYYQKVATLSIQYLEQGNVDAGYKAIEIYKKLKFRKGRDSIYQQILDYYVAKLSEGNKASMMLKFMEMCEILEDQKLASQYYQKAAKLYIQYLEQGDVDAGYKAIEIYDKLKIREDRDNIDLKIAEAYVKQLISGKKQSISKIKEFYQEKFKDHKHSEEFQSIFSLCEKYISNRIDAGVDIADIYEKIGSHETAKFIYSKIADRYHAQFKNGNLEAGVKAANLYQKVGLDATARSIESSAAKRRYSQLKEADNKVGVKSRNYGQK